MTLAAIERRLRRLPPGLTARDGGARRVGTGLLRLGAELPDAPPSHETVLAARTALPEHSRAAAQDLSRLLREAVAERGTRDVKPLSAPVQPLVVRLRRPPSSGRSGRNCGSGPAGRPRARGGAEGLRGSWAPGDS
ncbi:hypothetical protein SUDANB6_00629 [Streptomyces sp. enrichment culture]